MYKPGMTIHCMVQEGEALGMVAVPGPAFGEVVGTGVGKAITILRRAGRSATATLVGTRFILGYPGRQPRS